jgi:hypothetical protein
MQQVNDVQSNSDLSDNSSSNSSIERLMQSLNETMRKGQLPKLEMSVFKGDPLEFQQWIVSFEKLIEELTVDPARRLHYLLQYTAGSANTLVSGFTLDQSEEGYIAAKQELIKEFGDPYVLARAYLKKIETWKPIAAADASSLKTFSIFLKKCRGSMPSLQHLQQLNTDLYLQKIVLKLPYHVQVSWRKAVAALEEKGKSITFHELVNFVERESRIAKHPVFSAETLHEVEGKGKFTDDGRFQASVRKGINQKSKTVLATGTSYSSSESTVTSSASNTQASKGQTCPMCSKAHDLDKCNSYLNSSLEDRKKFLIQRRLCFACYHPTSRNHVARSCRRKRTCQICSKLHPTGLHGLRAMQQPGQFEQPPVPVTTDQNNNQNGETVVKTVTSCLTETNNEQIAMSIVMVRLIGDIDPSHEVVVYVALDSMSSASFITKEVWSLLGAPGEATEITVKTVSDERRQETVVVSGLQIAAMNGNKFMRLPKVYTQETLPIEANEIVTHDMLRRYPHLQHLTKEIPEWDRTVPIGLLIGVNCPKALEPIDFITTYGNGPFALKTALGWCVAGPVYSKDVDKRNDVLICNRVTVNKHQTTTSETNLRDMMIQMYEVDFNEPSSKAMCENWPGSSYVSSSECQGMSQEDQRFIKLMEREAKIINGHFQLPIPFRRASVLMPNNRSQAVQRALGLRKRFAADEKYHSDYSQFMKGLIDKGFARKAPSVSTGTDKSVQRWYLPHHGVYHPQKPGKIRVVFDCSCSYNGVSLNRELLQGPDLTNTLIGILFRFRQEPIAFMADIESMFCQVRIPESQYDFLSFVWWPDGDVSSELTDYQMQVHIFGAVSSPSCANFALKRTASENEVKFGAEAANTLRCNFYVDDLLKSVESIQKAVQLIVDVRSMCAAGGFRLTKFISNSRQVLESVPINERAQNMVNVDLDQTKLPIERALEVHWSVENDSIGFRIVLKDKPLTRRGILSTISSIYDPLGLAAPFLLTGKRLLQQLCNRHIDWDDEINEEDSALWVRWRFQLPLLEQIRVPRCFKPANFGKVISTSLHHFSDASQTGYGQCSYIRFVNESGEVHCSLVMGKSRVCPLKPVTVPRLELTAATISVKVGRMLKTELQYMDVESTYWTDSKAVLGYISNDVRRFHMFVAKRVQLIRENSAVESWNYVTTDNNPADDASRGIRCTDLSVGHRWFKGPDFLWQTVEHWPITEVDRSLHENDPEVRKQASVYTTNIIKESKSQSSVCVLDRLIQRHSSWYKLRKHVAWIVIVLNNLKSKSQGTEIRVMSHWLTVDELQRGEECIIKYVQSQAFSEEIKTLKSKTGDKHVKKSSEIYQLSPMLTERGLLCIEGRLSRSSLPSAHKHQIILPKKHYIAVLIARHYHELSGHSGKEYVLALLRQKYWIINARCVIRQVQRSCMICRKRSAVPSVQKMADLPSDRVLPDSPPFTYVGVDLFGPFFVKLGRNEIKRYGCIFTCLTIRAVHIEIAHSLDSSSFINALQRFICRRGQPSEIRSDNGTNFVGGERELREAVREWNKPQVQEYLRQKEIKWNFNPPTASHMGGVWERQIRSVRKILSALTKQQTLNDESLLTLMCTVENIINNRPLTTVPDDPEDLEPLTPNHLLQLRMGPSLPPGVFAKQDLYSRRRWRQVQYLADLFWKRWIKEYLPTLQLRRKWLKRERNVEVGDAVLLVDDDLPRNNWLLGRVISVFPGADGLVRTVEVKTKNNILLRPIRKVCVIDGA